MKVTTKEVDLNTVSKDGFGLGKKLENRIKKSKDCWVVETEESVFIVFGKEVAESLTFYLEYEQIIPLE